MKTGRCFSWWFMYDEDGRVAAIAASAGRLKPDGDWEFYEEIHDTPDNMSEEKALDYLHKYLSVFAKAAAVPFFEGKGEANNDIWNRPV